MNRDIKNQLIIILGAILFFVPFLGQVHLFDWDEINFAESAREMIVTGDYLTVRIFFEPFWEKPPLFIWFQVISMKIFGINEFAARFPNAVCGIITLLVLYNLGRKIYDSKFGILWVLSYGGAILPFFYFKSGIIDPWFNLFIFIGLYYWVLAGDTKSLRTEILRIVISASTIGLATLTKGPVSILVFGLAVGVLFLYQRFSFKIHWTRILLFFLVLSLVGGSWFLIQVFTGNGEVVVDFIVYQIRLFQTKDAGHGGFPMYHFIILLFGMFPASVFAIQGHKFVNGDGLQKSMHFSMLTLLWVVLILFSVVKTKIVHYSSLTYFPLSYLAAYALLKISSGEFKFRNWQRIMLLCISAVISLIIIILPFFIKYKDYFIAKGFITYSFTIGNLEAETGWTLFHSLIGLFLITGTFITVRLSKINLRKAFATLFGSTILFIWMAMVFITPGAEKISQNSVIEFMKDMCNKDVYVHTFYKSYATLFYANLQPQKNEEAFNLGWLVQGEIDKDAYFVARLDKKDEVLQRYPEVKVLYEKNGYVFCVRKAKTNNSDK